jgi:cobalt-zinc-cadmium efflux system outer membrane protein
MKSRYIFLILCAVPLSIHARAATGIAPECSRPTDVNSAMNCASKIHPGFNRSKLILDKAEAEVDRVSAFPNPELDTETLAGKAYGDEKFDFDIALVQTLEIGGARSARANAARAKQSVAHAEADLSDVALLMDSVGTFLRLAQLRKELASIDESLATFKRLVTQYQGRPRLNPEQEVSLAVFKVSVGDYIIKRGDTALALAQTEEKIRSLGITEIPATSANLPALPTAWPKLEYTVAKSGGFESLELRQAKASFNEAEAELSLARAESIPDLRIGPAYQFAADGALRTHRFGIRLSFALPVWNLNGGARASAHQSVKLANINLDQAQRSEDARVTRLFKQYQDNIASLAEIPSPDDLQRKHSRIEKLFFQGLITSPLMIESHRQLVELEKSRHERELVTLELFYKLNALQGNLRRLR